VVFGLLIPEHVASIAWSPVSGATAVHDRAGLERVIGLPVEEILACVEWFGLDATIMLSAAGTLLVAEAACRARPRPVLDLVVAKEKRVLNASGTVFSCWFGHAAAPSDWSS
jgi:hypothetical protein